MGEHTNNRAVLAHLREGGLNGLLARLALVLLRRLRHCLLFRSVPARKFTCMSCHMSLHDAGASAEGWPVHVKSRRSHKRLAPRGDKQSVWKLIALKVLPFRRKKLR